MNTAQNVQISIIWEELDTEKKKKKTIYRSFIVGVCELNALQPPSPPPRRYFNLPRRQHLKGKLYLKEISASNLTLHQELWVL